MIEEKKGITEAEDTLEGLGFDQLPIKPIEVVDAINSDDFKVVMETQNFQSEKILGKAQGNDSAALIYLNKNITDLGRFNFTAAHEIGHVCMHIMPQKIMQFECGTKDVFDPFNNPIERQANGFASGLLMPKYLVSKLVNGDINWNNIRIVSEACSSSLEATFRRNLLLTRDPLALVIHQHGKFKRFVASESFCFFIEKSTLSSTQRDLFIDVKHDEYPSDFDEVDASDWINPVHRGYKLASIYVSSIVLDRGFTYSLLTYDDDCYESEDDY